MSVGPTKLIRCLAIGAVAVGGGWVAEQMAPGIANADVYRTIQQRPSALIEALQFDDRAGGERQLVLNGMLARFDIGTTHRSPREVIDLATTILGTQPVETASKVIFSKDADDASRVRALLSAELHQPLRFDAAGMSALVQLADESISDPLAWIAALAKGDRSDQRGRGTVVLAQQSAGEPTTTVFVMRFDHSFNPFSFAAPSDKDAPGYDLGGISRFPGSLRVMSVSERIDASEGHIVIYRSAGSIGDRVAHYSRQFAALGLRPLSAEDKGSGRALIHFSGDHVEASVYVGGAENEQDAALDILQLRRT